MELGGHGFLPLPLLLRVTALVALSCFTRVKACRGFAVAMANFTPVTSIRRCQKEKKAGRRGSVPSNV